MPVHNSDGRACLERIKRKREKKAAKLAVPLTGAPEPVELRRFVALGIDRTADGWATARFEIAVRDDGSYLIVGQEVGKLEKRTAAINKFQVAATKDVFK